MEHGDLTAPRRVRESDVPALTALVHAAYAEHGVARLNFTAVDQTDATTHYRTFSGSSWALDNDGALIATATVSVPPSAAVRDLRQVARRDGMAWLNQLAVHPAHRATGHARTLLDRVLRHAQETDARCIGLDTEAPARALRDIYAGWGFVDEEVIHWPGKTYDSVVMTRAV